MFALMVRYEVGQAENAGAFVEEVIRGFDGNAELPGLLGSLLLTRPEDGEALQVLLFETAEVADEAEETVLSWPAPATGAREVVRGRRADMVGYPHWEAWQGRWHVRTDAPGRATAPS